MPKPKTIAKGAAGVAAAAGVVAGVAAMADKETRKTVLKGAKEVFKAASTKEMTDAMQHQYKATAHQISLNKKKNNTKEKSTSKQK